MGALADFHRQAAAERAFGDAALRRPAVLLHPVPAVHQRLNVLDSNDFSTYHALEVQLHAPLDAAASRTTSPTRGRSRWIRARSIPRSQWSAPATASTAADTPFDINNRKLNYAPSDFDRRHVVPVELWWSNCRSARARTGCNRRRPGRPHRSADGKSPASAASPADVRSPSSPAPTRSAT